MGSTIVVFLCFVCMVLAKNEIECEYKELANFATRDDRLKTCELKYVKFGAGRQLKFNENKTLDAQQVRVKFIESNIQAVPSVIFEKFEFMEILELNGVGLRNIFSNSFSRAKSLKVIQAYGNKLTMVAGFAFNGADQLEVLDLSSNIISNINYEAFSGLGKVKELSLSNNHISILDDQTFHPLKSLEWIYLDRNEIKIISNSLLVNSQNLMGIYLNDNKLSSLSTVLFDQLPNLQYLFLANNNCTNQNFVNTMIPQNANVKKELSMCFREFRTIVPDEEEKFKLKSVLRGAEKANSQCESDKVALLERLETAKKELAKLQKNGK